MPEVDEDDLKDEDVEMNFTRSSWAGWQHVNKRFVVQLKYSNWYYGFLSRWVDLNIKIEKKLGIF